ncbi:MAG: hypothetical protein M1528_01120 [Candidatus Marsarchaeota archaeon]|nr:hypothetical protein [Candidatus Marsarchaeota archaeon]MCL5115119.1 hypothetical protein [Candidatus Marsarchaeota archaeon]
MPSLNRPRQAEKSSKADPFSLDFDPDSAKRNATPISKIYSLIRSPTSYERSVQRQSTRPKTPVKMSKAYRYGVFGSAAAMGGGFLVGIGAYAAGQAASAIFTAGFLLSIGGSSFAMMLYSWKSIKEMKQLKKERAEQENAERNN